MAFMFLKEDEEKEEEKGTAFEGKKNSFPITPINYRGHCGQNEWD